MDKTERAERAQRQAAVRRVLFGVCLVGIGLLFTLANLGVVEAGRLRDYWPLALVALGMPNLIAPKDEGDPVWGAVTVAGGVFLQLRSLDLIDWSFWDVWPILVILAGVVILAGSLARPRPRGAAVETLENGGSR